MIAPANRDAGPSGGDRLPAAAGVRSGKDVDLALAALALAAIDRPASPAISGVIAGLPGHADVESKARCGLRARD